MMYSGVYGKDMIIFPFHKKTKSLFSIPENNCVKCQLNASLFGGVMPNYTWSQTSNRGRTLVGNKIVDHLDEVGASPVGVAPTTSSLST